MMTFQETILRLQKYWAEQGCALLQPLDLEVGAGTSHPATFLRAIGPEPWRAAYVQPSRRPKDARYGENPNRLHQHHQFQVVLKPSPTDILDVYLGSLEALGIDPLVNDIRFVEDNWENPTLGAWGLGWEVWMNGMEITQFTYFQQVGGLECKPITGEITYGIERLAMYLQNVDNVFDLEYCTWRDRGVRSHVAVWRRVPSERSRAEPLQLRGERAAGVAGAVQSVRGRSQAADGRRAGAAGVRDGAEVRPCVQSARCARRDQRDRARGIYRPDQDAVAVGRAELLRFARASRFSDAGRVLSRGTGVRASLLVEIQTEELPPKALKSLMRRVRGRH